MSVMFDYRIAFLIVVANHLKSNPNVRSLRFPLSVLYMYKLRFDK